MTFALPLDFAPMEARVVAAIPRDAGWQYEPKWDGFRALVFRDGDDVRVQSKSGKPLERYFPEVVASVRALRAARFVLDGELVIDTGGATSFDDLLARIHPAASRVEKLSRERPATYLVFDLLADGDESLVTRPLHERRARLEALAARALVSHDVRLSPATQSLERVDDWYARVGGALDGVVAKRLDAPYRSGERDAVVKIKAQRTADCVVGGYRTSASGTTLGSLLLGLYDEAGRLTYVGHSSGYSATEKRAMLERLQRLHAPVSFERNVPGGPSRWNRTAETAWQPVRPDIVLEVAYDQVTGERFRHGTRPLRLRPDKTARACGLDQIASDDRTIAIVSAAQERR
ncbi:MAG: ATP-dependent DNA ligase [Vulcanimicrobiaceae bacterium]